MVAVGCRDGLVANACPVALLALPLSVQAARLLLHHAAQPQQLGEAIKLTIGAMMVHGTLLSLAFILSKGNT